MSDKLGNFIGAFVYRRGREPGTLDADWVQSTRKCGVVCKGIATGGPEDGFLGDYSIVYQNEHGQPSKTYDLRIDCSGEIIHLTWHRDGRLIYQGVGMLRNDTIIGGWGPAQ